MKKIIFMCTSLALFGISQINYAAPLTCPSEKQIKNAKLILAKQYSVDPTCWNFTTSTFQHAGVKWNVVFGTFFPDAKTPEEALVQGQKYFNDITLKIKHPKPDQFPDKVICDYMSTGEAFWLSAVSPPEATPPSYRR